MVGWILKLLLLFMVVRALKLLVVGLVRGLSGAAQAPLGHGTGPGRVAPSHGTLVQDPVCGTYVLQERALTVRTPNGTAFFCSEGCRSAYDAQAARSR